MAPPGPSGGALPVAPPQEEAASVLGTGSPGVAESAAGHSPHGAPGVVPSRPVSGTQGGSGQPSAPSNPFTTPG
eukprot:3288277-Pyramimonas_sp.AAC.1